jgi:hypothetical protein
VVNHIEKKEQELPGNGPNICQSKFIGMNIAKDQYIVGGIFMRKFYTVFDRDNDRVGIALAKSMEDAKCKKSLVEDKKSLAEVSSEDSLTEMKVPSTYIDEE